jgi:hypothetical protein
VRRSRWRPLNFLPQGANGQSSCCFLIGARGHLAGHGPEFGEGDDIDVIIVHRSIDAAHPNKRRVLVIPNGNDRRQIIQLRMLRDRTPQPGWHRGRWFSPERSRARLNPSHCVDRPCWTCTRHSDHVDQAPPAISASGNLRSMYGILGIGLMLICLRVLIPAVEWKDGNPASSRSVARSPPCAL